MRMRRPELDAEPVRDLTCPSSTSCITSGTAECPLLPDMDSMGWQTVCLGAWRGGGTGNV
jgi:hypothetical protein